MTDTWVKLGDAARDALIQIVGYFEARQSGGEFVARSGYDPERDGMVFAKSVNHTTGVVFEGKIRPSHIGALHSVLAAAPTPTAEPRIESGGDALREALGALASVRHLLTKYADTKDHHWLPVLDRKISTLKAALAAQPQTATGQGAGERVREFACAILHGDDEHRAWLSEAAEAFLAGLPLPAPRGKGTLATPSPTPAKTAEGPVPAQEGGALADIAAERRRQIEVEGWTPEHDDRHQYSALATAAACYIRQGRYCYSEEGKPGPEWPWAPEWWKPAGYRRNLVKAGALIVAEIERLDRQEPSA